MKIWNECAFKHKLVYIDNIKKFVGNEHTAFGTAMHYVCERVLTDKKKQNYSSLFEEKFLEELSLLKKSNVELKKELINSMRGQGNNLIDFIFPAVKKYFDSFDVVSVEESLMEDLENTNLKFKGYVDLVLKTSDGKYHVIDWKTCSWGWDTKRKNEKITNYQLALYKNFFAIKHGIDPKNIETYFALLKRTAKSNKVEIFRTTSGSKKIQNSLKLLSKAVYNIENKNFIKNRLSCTSGFGCEFYKTKHCR
tara:strand:+ start:301 stop:1053 length:753 start_codon:yes stop_codon:yes gene_type:complete